MEAGTSIIAEFGKFGPVWMLVSLIVVGMGVAIGVMWKYMTKLQDKISHLQNAQLELAKEFNKDMLSIADDHNKAISSMTIVINSLKDYLVNRRS